MTRNSAEQVLENPIIGKLKFLLEEIQQSHIPHLPNPSGCHKRASVALVIRVRPRYPDHANWHVESCGPAKTFYERLTSYFSLPWVQRGHPEILFIKRAARTGDRWTGHVALPGGKRDPGDADDSDTSRREAEEEVGLDLGTDHCLLVGKLSERVIFTSWGNVPLMVLCPYVYLLLRHDLPPLTLQPSEVHSAHWIPIHVLLSPSSRTLERCDVSERFTRQGSQVSRYLIRFLIGQMLFTAIRLNPTESVYHVPPNDGLLETYGILGRKPMDFLRRWLLSKRKGPQPKHKPLLLWGLTLGIIADFLGPLSSAGVSGLWGWPTLTAWDMQLIIWIMTYKFKLLRLKELKLDEFNIETDLHQNGINGIDVESFSTDSTTSMKRAKPSAVGNLLRGYYNLVRKAIVSTLLIRLGFGTYIAIALYRKLKRHRHHIHSSVALRNHANIPSTSYLISPHSKSISFLNSWIH